MNTQNFRPATAPQYQKLKAAMALILCFMTLDNILEKNDRDDSLDGWFTIHVCEILEHRLHTKYGCAFANILHTGNGSKNVTISCGSGRSAVRWSLSHSANDHKQSIWVDLSLLHHSH